MFRKENKKREEQREKEEANLVADRELKEELKEFKYQFKYEIDKALFRDFQNILSELEDFRNGYSFVVNGQQRFASGYFLPENAKQFKNIYEAIQEILKLLADPNPIIEDIEKQVALIKTNLMFAMQVAQEELKNQISDKNIFHTKKCKLQEEYFKVIQKIETFGLSVKYLISDSTSSLDINYAVVNGQLSKWLTRSTFNKFEALKRAINAFVTDYGAALGISKSSEDLVVQMERIMAKASVSEEQKQNGKKEDSLEQQLAQLAGIGHVRFENLVKNFNQDLRACNKNCVTAYSQLT